MSDTANLGLPLIQAAQAQKHVTHNEALRLIDTLVQLAVLDRDLNSPPGAPAEGERFIVAASPTGAWAGHFNHVAAWQDGGWAFSAPRPGWVAFVIDEGTLLAWNGSAWGDLFSTVTSIQNLARLGIGTTADATHPLSARLNNALWAARTVAEGGDGHLRYKLSKESAGKTLSLLFQDDFSGRAEFGLTGDDDFHVKVSPDGSSWLEGLRIDRATGKVSFPVSGGPREMLAADRTYYVRSDGSDANSGLADSAGAAFLTVQKAIDVAAALDLSIYNVTIQLGSGTYTQALTLRSLMGSGGNVIIKGDSTTPSNVVLNGNGSNVIDASANLRGTWALDGLKLTTSSGNGLIIGGGGARLNFKNIDFGSVAAAHIFVQFGALVQAIGNYKITGGAARHINVNPSATFNCDTRTITLTGTPAFSAFFADARHAGALIYVAGSTYSGSATGARYNVDDLASIFTNGAGASFLPGDSVGSTANGGQYY